MEPVRRCEAPPRLTPKRPVPTAPFELGAVVLGLDGPDEVGLLSAQTEMNLSSQMTSAGFKAETPPPNDPVGRSSLVLTGTVRELACLRNRCRIAVSWVLTNRLTDQRVYELMSRAMVESPHASGRGAKLLAGAMSSLMAHDNFRAAVAASRPVRSEWPAGCPQTFASCSARTKKLPAGSDAVLNATAIVRTAHHTGSAFFVSPDGIAITAAHVLEGSDLTLVLRDGTEVQASAIRSALDADVALVRPKLRSARSWPLRSRRARRWAPRVPIRRRSSIVVEQRAHGAEPSAPPLRFQRVSLLRAPNVCRGLAARPRPPRPRVRLVA